MGWALLIIAASVVGMIAVAVLDRRTPAPSPRLVRRRQRREA
jgi:hypothetical protein